MPAALLTTEIPADPSGWWISEKFDGVRAIWNGEEFISRHGKVLPAPDWFKEGMPDVRLDGEIFAGRGNFNQLLGELKRKGQSWQCLVYKVFDTCDMDQRFEDRAKSILDLDLPAHAHAVNHHQCVGASHLNSVELEIVAGGGEGAVIRRPQSLYRPGRSGDVVKVKRLVDDEARWGG